MFYLAPALTELIKYSGSKAVYTADIETKIQTHGREVP